MMKNYDPANLETLGFRQLIEMYELAIRELRKAFRESGETVFTTEEHLDGECELVYHFYREKVYRDYSGAKIELGQIQELEKTFAEEIEKIEQDKLWFEKLSDLTSTLISHHGADAKLDDVITDYEKGDYFVKRATLKDYPGSEGAQRALPGIRISPNLTSVHPSPLSVSVAFLPNNTLHIVQEQILENISEWQSRFADLRGLDLLRDFRMIVLENVIGQYERNGMIERGPEAFLECARLALDTLYFSQQFENRLKKTGEKVRVLWGWYLAELHQFGLSPPYSTVESFQSTANRNGFEIRQHTL